MLNYYDDSNRKAFALITSSEWNRIDRVCVCGGGQGGVGADAGEEAGES